MRISKISWKNYRQYKDQTIEFPLNGKYDLHYFVAENGIGKTTFFNSVYWCLYEDEPYLTAKDRAFSILSQSVKKEMEVGDMCQVSVEVVVECEKGQIHYIREADMRKTEEGDAVAREIRSKVITVYHGEDSKSYEDEETTKRYINQFVPDRLKDYYFFDAEGLKDYFGDDSNEKVRTAIFEISDIATLRIMLDHLGELEKKYRTALTKNNPKTKQMNVDLVKLTTQYDKKVVDKNTLVGEISVAEEGLRECKLVLDDEEDIEELEAKRVYLTATISEYEDKLISAKSDLKAFVRRYTVLLNTYKQMQKMYEKLCLMDENDELPPKITREYLLEMKSAHKCLVCDREFDGSSLSKIEKLIEQHRSKETLTEINKIKGCLEMLMAETREYPEKRHKFLERLNEIQTRRDELIDDKKAIDISYFSIPDVDKIKHYATMRQRYEKERFQKSVDLEVIKRSIKELSSECKNLSEAIDVENAKEKTHEKASKCKSLVSTGKTYIENIMENIQDEIRDQISKKTGEIFLGLMWKKVIYAKVGLTKDYAISAKDEDGEEGVGSTSGAEEQLLALSFMLALQSVSGFNSPLIIDTPVARTSGILRGNFCDALKDVSKEKQVILFFTEDEINSKVKNALQFHASNRFSIALKDESYVEMRCLNV